MKDHLPETESSQIPDDPPGEEAATVDGDLHDLPARPQVDHPTRTGDAREASLSGTVTLPTMIGGYRVMGILGEGGMGTVYEAEQQRPKRRVAVKVVRGGEFVDEQRVRMFKREADSLARLKHPNIGAIYESGCTADGQHFFAMELVRGDTLQEHLAKSRGDSSGEDLRSRLQMFRQISDAVHYAHQRGVIHRDLKPANILVTQPAPVSSESVSAVRPPEVKILDFGLARITDTDVAAATMTTQVGAIKGTLPYMSPEQARGNPADIDLRTDVYALGVILYEMLTGKRPYQTQATSLIEAIRVICEEPPRPLRTTWAGGGLDSDIATIVGKALEKQADRRYASCAALSEDITRYLAKQPILARPPSTVYQLQKLASRNRAAVGGIAATFLALVGGIVVSTTLGLREAAQRHEAERARGDLEKVVELQADMLGDADAAQMGRRLVADLRQRIVEAQRTAGATEQQASETLATFDGAMSGVNTTDAALRMIDEDILTRAAETIDTELVEQPLIGARLRTTIGETYERLGLYDRGEPHLTDALDTRRQLLGDTHPDTLKALNSYGRLTQARGDLKGAEGYLRLALEQCRQILGSDHPQTLEALNSMGLLLQAQGNPAQAESMFREALEGRRRVLGNDHPDTLESVSDVGFTLRSQGRLDQAEPFYREALAGNERVLGSKHPDTLLAMNNLGTLLMVAGDFAEAEEYYRAALDGRREVLGADHPSTLTSVGNMGSLLKSQGRLDEAETYHTEAHQTAIRVLGEDHPTTLTLTNNLGHLFQLQRRFENAETWYRQALEGRRRVLGDDHPHTLVTIHNMGDVYFDSKRYEDAERYYREAVEGRRRVLGEDQVDTLTSLDSLGRTEQRRGRLPEAEMFLDQAVAGRRRVLPSDDPKTLSSIEMLGWVLERQEKLAEAELLHRESLDIRRRATTDRSTALASSLINLALNLNKQRRYSEAEPFLRESLEIRRELLPPGDWRIPNTESILGECLAGQVRFDEAERLLLGSEEALRNHPKAPAARKQDAVERVIQLYRTSDKPDRVSDFQKTNDTPKAGD